MGIAPVCASYKLGFTHRAYFEGESDPLVFLLCLHFYDSLFQILVGPSDWEDHSLGKEGATRYRVHNLPNCASCAGVYELGIALSHIPSTHKGGKLDPDHIVPVYLGQADNVRARLQRYGQAGAHLENGNSTRELIDSVRKGPGLFTEIFSRGLPIVFRWAPVSISFFFHFLKFMPNLVWTYSSIT